MTAAPEPRRLIVFGASAAGLAVARQVCLVDGTTCEYDALVVATGAAAVRPVSLGVGLAGSQVVRGLPDALRLRDALAQGSRPVVVGAGFVGAEAATVARGMGVPVTVVDPLALPMVGVLGEEVAQMLAERHRAAGVDLRCGVDVTEVPSETGRTTGAALDDGSVDDATNVLVAVGARPAVGWFADSGVPLGDRKRDGFEGVLCDKAGRAGEGIWAAGDMAAWLDPASGRHRRSEHRLAATEEGRAWATAWPAPYAPGGGSSSTGPHGPQLLRPPHRRRRTAYSQLTQNKDVRKKARRHDHLRTPHPGTRQRGALLPDPTYLSLQHAAAAHRVP
ncbi:FAD-dependent oxidoreductase [Streptomyces sp. OE57]|uniref:FAD-dependent oxidoreductase n=1 Tax=Streptomyces lacaronensis TaxID=3379885 RepID=UPI0039B76387